MRSARVGYGFTSSSALASIHTSIFMLVGKIPSPLE